MRISRLTQATVCAGVLAVAAGAGLLRGSEAASGVAAELLGQRRAAVLERLGPPSSIGTSAVHLEFSYPGSDGTELKIALHEGIVFFVSPSDARLPSPRPIPATGAYLGQAIEETIQRLGTPVSFSVGTLTLTVSCSDGSELHFAHGIVTG